MDNIKEAKKTLNAAKQRMVITEKKNEETIGVYKYNGDFDFASITKVVKHFVDGKKTSIDTSNFILAKF